MTVALPRKSLVVAALPLLAVVCAIVAVAGAVINSRADRTIRVTRNLLVNQPGIIDADNSPTIVRNPRRAGNLVVSYRVDRPRYSAVIQTTFDEGATWRPTRLPLPPDKDRAFAPDIAFSDDGVLHVVYTNLTGNGNVPDNLWTTTSTDGGRTLGAPVRLAGGLAFQPRIAVGPKGIVHVTWLQADTVGILRFAGAPPVIQAVRSNDGGKTFSSPVRVNDAARVRVGAATPVVDGSGRLRVLYEDFKDDRRDFENLEGPAYEKTFALVMTTATGDGAAFAPGKEVESSIVPGKRFFAFLPDFPSFAAGPGDDLYIAWADARAGSDDVYLKRSTDGGSSWSGAKRVNDNRLTDGTTQYLPRLAVAPGGRVDVLYLDRRRDPQRNVMTEVSLATSSNGGASFDNVRVSDKAFDSGIGPSIRPEFGVDFGTKLGLINSARTAVAVWSDSRFGNETTGRQDIVGAAVQLPEGLPLIAEPAVVLSVVGLGLVALVAWRLRLRRAGGPETAPPQPDPAPEADSQPAPDQPVKVES